MKPVCFLFLFLFACGPNTQESASRFDSLAVPGYEDFSEVGPFTVKNDIRNQRVELKNKRKPLLDYLILFYHPDTYTPHSVDDSVNMPQYIITEAKAIENTFFTGEGKPCQTRSILMTSRGDFVDKEYYDLLFIGEDVNGDLKLVDKVTFDGSEGQSSTLVSVSPEELSPRTQCRVLAVTSVTEGGDINLRKRKWIEYYMADSKSFHPILRLDTEITDIQDYEATQDVNQNSSSEFREIKLLNTSTHGLFDIEVHYTKIQNGSIASESSEVFVFNGSEYASK